jgi:predicted phosphodiesterase
MEVALLSDLHLECKMFDIEAEVKGADVLILSGDVCEARNTGKFLSFFTNCSKKFKHVLYVFGNHEFYGEEYHEAKVKIKNTLQHLSNIIILDNESITIDGVLFIGSTFWTDFNKEDPISMWQCRRVMNDYNLIRIKDEEIESRRLQPQDTVVMHQEAKKKVTSMLEQKDIKTVVITHHCPTSKSVHEKYKGATHINGAYFSNQENLIFDNPQIALWTHGHTHEPFDYMCASTRVVCNPRGYAGYEESSLNYATKFIEI